MTSYFYGKAPWENLPYAKLRELRNYSKKQCLQCYKNKAIQMSLKGNGHVNHGKSLKGDTN